jgi:hypothetical protein
VGDVLAEQLDLAVKRGLLRAQGEQLVVVGVALALGAAAGDHRLRLPVGELCGGEQPGGEQGRGRDVDGSGRVGGVLAGAGQLAVLDPAAQRVDRLVGQVGGLAQGIAPVVGGHGWWSSHRRMGIVGRADGQQAGAVGNRAGKGVDRPLPWAAQGCPPGVGGQRWKRRGRPGVGTARQPRNAYAGLGQAVRKVRKRVRKPTRNAAKTGAIAPVFAVRDRFPDPGE